MPPFLVRVGRHGEGWLAVVYVAEGDLMIPAAVVVGPWPRVRRATLMAGLLAPLRRDGLNRDVHRPIPDV